MNKIEKYSDLWILHLASSNGFIKVNPLKYKKPKWWSRLWILSKAGLLNKARFSCDDFRFELTDKGRCQMKLGKPNEQ